MSLSQELKWEFLSGHLGNVCQKILKKDNKDPHFKLASRLVRFISTIHFTPYDNLLKYYSIIFVTATTDII